MSFLKTTAIQHLNGSSPTISLSSNGNATFANNLYIRGQTGQVTNPLQIKFSNDYPGAGGASSNTADKMKLVFYDNSPIDIYSIGVGPSADMQYHAYQGSFGQGSHNFYTENLLRMKIDGSGFITKPYQPMFYAWQANATQSTGPFVFSQTRVNVGGYYNTSNGRFTAPVAGSYIFHGHALHRSQLNTGNAELTFYKNGSNVGGRGFVYSSGYSSANGHIPMMTSVMLTLAAGDYVQFGAYVITSPTDVYLNDGLAHFSGYLLG